MVKELTSMGYRHINDKGWAKPVGNHLFVYKPSESTWYNWIQGTSELLVWNRKEFVNDGEDDSFLNFIKECECSGKTDYRGQSEFHFLTRIQQIELIL